MTELESEKIAELEAMLYASGRPLSLTNLCRHLKLPSEREVLDLIKKLSYIYQQNNSPLEIIQVSGERVVLQLKPDYSRQAQRFSNKPLLTPGPLKTLSFVAYHQPVTQKEAAGARGSQAYRHLSLLVKMGLISKEKKGRQTIIRTTPEFADYLGLSHDRSSMRRQLRSIFKKLEVKELEKK